MLEAARYIPLDQLGTTDDCGFSPFSDDTSTTRETAFAKIRARVEGTALATEALASGPHGTGISLGDGAAPAAAKGTTDPGPRR